MTDTTHETSTDAAQEHTRDGPADDGSTFGDAARVAAWLGVGIATLIAVVALFRFFGHATAAIETLAPAEHADLFLAGFNLAVLLVAAAVVLVLVRRLATDDLL